MTKAKDIRRNDIVEFINSRGDASFQQIKRAFPDVSEMTLRVDLKELDAQRRIIRAYGGAKSIKNALGADDPLNLRLERDADAKMIIAEKARTLISDDVSTVFLDSGSTTTTFARIFPDHERVVVTPSLTCASELARLKEAEITQLGGNINKKSLCVQGGRSVRELGRMHFEQVFLSTTAYASGFGFTCEVDEQAALKRVAINQGDEIVMLMDSHKVEKPGTFRFCGLDDLDVIVSDGQLPASFCAACEEAGVRIL